MEHRVQTDEFLREGERGIILCYEFAIIVKLEIIVVVNASDL